MDLEGIVLSEISQTGEDIHCRFSLICFYVEWKNFDFTKTSKLMVTRSCIVAEMEMVFKEIKLSIIR